MASNNRNRIIKYESPKRGTLLLLIPIIAAPLGGLLLFQTGWYMFLSCLVSYFVQIVLMCMFFLIKNKVIETNAADIEKHIDAERGISITCIGLLVITAILDFYPYFAWSDLIMVLLGLPRTWDSDSAGVVITVLLPIGMLAVNAIFIYSWREKSTFFKVLKQFKKTGLTPDEQAQKEKDEKLQKEQEKQAALLAAETEKYGEGYQVISREKILFMNEGQQKLYIGSTGYDFKDILDFNVQDKVTTKTSPVVTTTRTEDTYGRYVMRPPIGGIGGSKVGTFVGFPSNTTVVETSGGERYDVHRYNVHITLNNLSNPVVTVNLGQDYDAMNRLRAVLTVIVSRNKG